MAVLPLSLARSTVVAWDQRLLTTITPAGREARLHLDPHSAMVTLLRQPWLAAPWCQRTNRLALVYGRPTVECHRLLLHAVHREWVSLHAPVDTAPLALRALLADTGLLSEARLAALDRRLTPGRPLRLVAIGHDLTKVGWLRPADLTVLQHLGRLAVWHW